MYGWIFQGNPEIWVTAGEKFWKILPLETTFNEFYLHLCCHKCDIDSQLYYMLSWSFGVVVVVEVVEVLEYVKQQGKHNVSIN